MENSNYIYEGLMLKKELTDFESSWINWLYKHGEPGKLPPSDCNVKEKLISFCKQHYWWDTIEYQEDNPDYYYCKLLATLLWKNRDLLQNVDMSTIKSKETVYKLVYRSISAYDSDMCFEEFVDKYISDKDKFERLYTAYMLDYFFANFHKEAKVNKDGYLQVVRSISIPKQTFTHEGFESYEDWIDCYFDGLGIYWSFAQGGVYCFQSFTDGKMVDSGNSITLDVYAYAPYDSIDKGGTFNQLSGGFDTEQEITMISGEPVEVYKVVVKQNGVVQAKLPIKSVICRC